MIFFMVLVHILTGLIWFLRILSFMIIANALLSWFLDPMHPVRELLGRFVNPILSPVRRLTDKLTAKSSMPIDLSLIITYFALLLLIQLLSDMQTFFRFRILMY